MEMPTTPYVPLGPPLALLKDEERTITNVSILPPIYNLVVDVLLWVKVSTVP
jgi:hypothetical protein